ncbi:hypothetical protein V1511DRAFT_493618 [Dipodascopsis uninucleata]
MIPVLEARAAKAPAVERPKFEDLPLRKGDPPYSAWGLWGDDDELGALNLITPEVTKEAVKTVEYGITIPLNLPLNEPAAPWIPNRIQFQHNIIEKGYANDDTIYMNTQSSSQWDSLRHFPYQDGLLFYNGTTQAHISGTETSKATSRNGIQNMAKKGIASRGVLLDWHSWAVKNGIEHDPFSRYEIPLEQLLKVAEEEKVTFKSGDILLIRTGVTEEFFKKTQEEQEAVGKREVRSFIGVPSTPEVAKWHWDNQFAAVATDTTAYEVWPKSDEPIGDWDFRLHEVFMGGWGLPLGEIWDLEELAKACKEIGRWEFLIVSQPLYIEGGVASPPNAMAII